MSELATLGAVSTGPVFRRDPPSGKVGPMQASNALSIFNGALCQAAPFRRPSSRRVKILCSLPNNDGNKRRSMDSTVPQAVRSGLEVQPLTTPQEVSKLDLESQIKWFEAWALRSKAVLAEAERAEAATREDYHNLKQIAQDLRRDAETASARVKYRHSGDDASHPEACTEAVDALAAAQQAAAAAEAQFERLDSALEESTWRAHAATVTLCAAVKTLARLQKMLEMSKTGIEDVHGVVDEIVKSSNATAKALMEDLADYKDINGRLLNEMESQRKHTCPLWDREVESELEIELGWAAYFDWFKKDDMQIWSDLVVNEAEAALGRLGVPTPHPKY